MIMFVNTMKYRLHLLLALTVLCGFSLGASAQTVKNASYQTVAYIKSDGTIQDGSYRTIGYIKSDGTVQDSSYRTIGHADGVPMKWAAFYFFFLK